MSTFNPTRWTLEPPDRPDHLAAAVLQSLSRPIGSAKVWGALRSFVLGGLTFGILPLLVWPKRFGDLVVAEQQQMWHLAEWLRLRTGDPEAAQLKNAIPARSAPLSLWLIPLVMIGIILATFGPWVGSPSFDLHNLILAAYQAPKIHGAQHLIENWGGLSSQHAKLFDIWTTCMVIAYTSHWLHIRGHIGEMKRLVRRINPILQRQQLPPVTMGWTMLGIRPFWVAAAVIGTAAGAWWAIPAALAGAAQQRYMLRTGVYVRGQLSQRVQMALLSTRPAIDVPTPFRLRLLCSNRLCGKPAITGTTFCTRCGTRLPQGVAG